MGDPGNQTHKKNRLKHRFFVAASRFKAGAGGETTAMLDKDTAHHLRQALRLSCGATVTLFDNSGQEYECEVTECRPSLTVVKVLRATAPEVESSVKITLAQAILKGNAFERALTLATELGAARFVPLYTSRTVVRLNKAEAADRVPRWEKVVEAAAAQSGRVKVPYVDMPMDLKDFLDKKTEALKIILWERGGSGQLQEILEDERAAEILLLAGPEGGFAQAEVKAAMDAGYKIWGLGPRVLRAENAGAIALSILQYQLGDMG
jgi:16S rRNA (uracil1498-N3)-methyltransferase